jgi:type III pantothenate kinase
MEWLGLIIGNSRLHWAWWQGDRLRATAHAHHPDPPPDFFRAALPLYVASVVPPQTERWRSSAHRVWQLTDIPLGRLYNTLGIDRALGAYGAGTRYGYPVLAIDGGTALTLTGIDGDRCLVGGAIWPGLGLQLGSLGRGTAALPTIELTAGHQIERWSRNTADAIVNGVLLATRAGLRDFVADWQGCFPGSAVVVTGGDGPYLVAADLQGQWIFDPELLWWGMKALVAAE